MIAKTQLVMNGGLTMIKRYHNKAARKIHKKIFNRLRGYTGDSRHRRAKAVAMALLLDAVK